MTGLGHLPITSEAASTCDLSYLDAGRACAWNTFLCEDFGQSQTVPDALRTCFEGSHGIPLGSQQSPINLDVNEAEVRDPSQLTFSGYAARLSHSPVIRLRSFALQLDFEQTSTTTTTTTTTTSTTTTAAPRKESKPPTRHDVQLPNITGGALEAKT